MIIRTLAYVVGVTLSAVACSDSATGNNSKSSQIGEQKSQDGLAISETTYQLKKEIPSDDSPVGYWEIDISYPQFESADSSLALANINNSIKALSDKYSCDGSGDKTFTAVTEYQSPRILSLSYESMWLCSTMPHPDSESGSIVYDIRSGETIPQNQFFSSAKKKEEFYRLVAEQQKQKLNDPSWSCQVSITIQKEGVKVGCSDHGVGESADIIFSREKLKKFFSANALK